ncbi:MAG: hydroxylamine reductase, partial [Desulfobulbaceae bacterium]
MYCNQCEQTAKGIACTTIGVCGKNEEVAGLEDLLTHAVQGLCLLADAGRKVGVVDNAVDRFTCEAIFSCLTNVDFDPARFGVLIHKAVALRETLKAEVKSAGGTIDFSAAAATFTPADSLTGLEEQGAALNFINTLDANPDLQSLKQITMYGLRGLAAYADHAAILGQEDDAVYAYLHEAMAALTSDMDLNQLVALALKCGEVNLRAMELLDA